MKTNKLFRVNVEKANAIYSVFKTCNVFTILLDGTLLPVYDFSGNNVRSSLNSLRKYYPDSVVRYHFKVSFYDKNILPTPFHLTYSDCILFF